jgi:hypothetical protein
MERLIGRIKDFANKNYGEGVVGADQKPGGGKAYKSTLIYAASAIEGAVKRQLAAVRQLGDNPNDEVREGGGRGRRREEREGWMGSKEGRAKFDFFQDAKEEFLDCTRDLWDQLDNVVSLTAIPGMPFFLFPLLPPLHTIRYTSTSTSLLSLPSPPPLPPPAYPPLRHIRQPVRPCLCQLL